MLAFDRLFPLFPLKLTSAPFAEQQRKRGQKRVESGNTRPARRDCEKFAMQPRGLSVGCLLISMQRGFVLTNWRTRGDRAGLIRTGAASATCALTHAHTHKQTLNLQSSFTLLAALPSLRFHSDTPRSAMQRRGAALRFNNSHCWERGRLPESSQASETHYYGAK